MTNRSSFKMMFLNYVIKTQMNEPVMLFIIDEFSKKNLLFKQNGMSELGL